MIHVHAPAATGKRIVRDRCPTCERLTAFVGFFTPWYGWSETCLRCGERWEDGEMLPRPFAPGWRKRSIAHARARYRRMVDRGGRGMSPVIIDRGFAG